jgi:dephospho-CoA kinase
MTKKKPSSSSQLISRMYRRQITMDQQLGALIALVANVPRFRETIKTLADHVLRLTREKEILLKREMKRQLTEANTFVAQPLAIRVAGFDDLVLADVTESNAAPLPATALHEYDAKGRRCQICECLKEAIEAGGLNCVDPTTDPGAAK